MIVKVSGKYRCFGSRSCIIDESGGGVGKRIYGIYRVSVLEWGIEELCAFYSLP